MRTPLEGRLLDYRRLIEHGCRKADNNENEQ
jgi:hypothetical protein